MTDHRAELIIKEATKCKQFANAISIKNRATQRPRMIVLGDDGLFWVLDFNKALYLVNRGYSLAE